MKSTTIHGRVVYYEQDAQAGIDYLSSRIDRDEALMFFDAAKAKKMAKFEDQNNRDWSLVYTSDGKYILTSRKQSGSGGGFLDNIFGL